MGAETPGEERGPRRVGDHNLVQTRAQVLAALQSDRSLRGWHSARQGARLHRRVLAWRGCWEGALVRSRESQGRTRPLCFGEGLSGHSRGEWEFGAGERGSGEMGDQCVCSLRARTAWRSAAAFLISHTLASSLLSPNAVPGPTAAGTLSPPSLSLSADRRNMVKREPPSPPSSLPEPPWFRKEPLWGGGPAAGTEPWAPGWVAGVAGEARGLQGQQE